MYKSRFLKAERRAVRVAAGSHTYRTAFEQQARFDDIYLQPGAAVRPDTAGWGGPLLVLPIVGGALLTTPQETDKPLLPGYLYTVPAAEAAALTLTNPFEQETVNVLLLHVTLAAAADGAGVQESALPLTAKNLLVAAEAPNLPAQVGCYDSRVKDTIAVAGATGYALCYVINGSFEVEDRLAEHRDALLLWDAATIGFEALAETSILFYLHFDARPGAPVPA